MIEALHAIWRHCWSHSVSTPSSILASSIEPNLSLICPETALNGQNYGVMVSLSVLRQLSKDMQNIHIQRYKKWESDRAGRQRERWGGRMSEGAGEKWTLQRNKTLSAFSAETFSPRFHRFINLFYWRNSCINIRRIRKCEFNSEMWFVVISGYMLKCLWARCCKFNSL